MSFKGARNGTGRPRPIGRSDLLARATSTAAAGLLLLAVLMPVALGVARAQLSGGVAPPPGVPDRAEGTGPAPFDESQRRLATATALLSLHYQAGRYEQALPHAQTVLELTEAKFGAGHAETANALNTLGEVFRSLARFDEATKTFEKAKVLYEAGGNRTVDYAMVVGNLATVLFEQSRYIDAEALLGLAIDILEKTSAQDLQLANRLNTLGAIRQSRGLYDDARMAYDKCLQIRERLLRIDHPDIAQVKNNLAALAVELQRYNEGEELHLQSLAIRRRVYGDNSPQVATALANLAIVYQLSGRLREAMEHFTRALAVLKAAGMEAHPDYALQLSNLGGLQNQLGQYADAERSALQAATIFERALPPGHPALLSALNVQAVILERAGRLADAENIHRRLLSLREATFGPNHADVSESLVNVAELMLIRKAYDDARPLLERSVEIARAAKGPTHRDVAHRLNMLGRLQRLTGDLDAAERTMLQSLAIFENPQTLNDLAWLFEERGDFAGAERYYRRVVEGLSSIPDHPDIGTAQANIARLYAKQRDWQAAAASMRAAADLLVRRLERFDARGGQIAEWDPRTEADDGVERFKGMVKIAGYLAKATGNADAFPDDLFVYAQYAQISRSAAALSQMAARGMQRHSALPALVRERQDLANEWQKLEQRFQRAHAEPTAERDRAAEAAMDSRMSGIDSRIRQIDEKVASDFPDFALIRAKAPLAREELQAYLRADEALVFFLDTSDWNTLEAETYVWVITKTKAEWRRVPLGTEALADRIATLRCGLDGEEWKFGRPLGCERRLGLRTGNQAPVPLPFHLGIAHELYAAFFAPFADLIAGRHLLVVPSGPMTSLPFQVLATTPSAAPIPRTFEGYREISWLGARQPITVLPAITSLRALRRFAQVSAATKPYAGYGNPDLVGNGACKRSSQNLACSSLTGPAAAQTPEESRQPVQVRSGSIDSIYRQGASREQIAAGVNALCPLPDSARELQCVARSLGAPEGELRLGKEATEANIKARSAAGELANYRILHFATHGLVAGDLGRLREPGLALTPPEEPENMGDDGLLTASEVAELKLDAEWVILSACNTAAGDGIGAEAFSGLARAFFYAGARAILVSHWPVYSDAAAQMLDRAFAELRSDPALGRAEAFRRAQLAMLQDRGHPDNPHPSVWAPFAVVGEGAR